ncbi:MAG: EAL domain-containing protein [Gammaproteobacteria bacterium]|nr:EAL domain-containing protein [Gammaproteobacteria bacterium]
MPNKKYKSLTPLLISLVSFTALSLIVWFINLSQHNAHLSLIIDSSTSAKKMAILASMAEMARSRTRLTAQMIEEKDVFVRDEIQLEMDRIATQFTLALKNLNEIGLESYEEQVLKRQREIIMEILPQQRLAAEFALSGEESDIVRARSILFQNVLPGQGEVIKNIMSMINYHKETIDQQAAQSIEQHHHNLKQQYLLLIFILILAVVIVWITIRKIIGVETLLFSERERAELTLTSIQDGVIVIDAQMTITELNKTATEFMSVERQAALGKSIREVINLGHIQIEKSIIESISQVLDGEQKNERTREAHIMVGDVAFNVDILISPIVHDSHIDGAIITFRDITEKKKLSEEIAYQARHDVLTGLLNRNAFQRECKAKLSGKAESEHHLLSLLDLDRFKVVNDTCGHNAGDELLKQVATILRTNTRKNELIARMGGDEFAILLENCSLSDGLTVINKIIQSIAANRFDWQDNSFAISCSAGLVAVDGQEPNLNDLLHSADTACYLAKDEGRNRVRVFDQSSIELIDRKEQSSWVTRINQAIEQKQFFMELQPIFDTHSPDSPAVKMELLIRLKDGEKTILPMAFLPAAERYGLISQIDLYVLERALNLLHQNQESPILTMNLSGKTLGDKKVTDEILSKLAKSDVDYTRLCFEITETEMIANLSTCQDFINQAREQGVKISLDDFGSGLSSFNYLDILELDFIKIDGTFVQKMLNSNKTRAMVESINHIAHTIGLKTIAEYIDRDELLKICGEIGIDYLQGFLLGRPKRPEEYGLKE